MHLHPFDRALDYTISMFDFVMDESDTFARYWCKYYGMYPIDVQIEGLTNSNNDALKNEMIVTVTFKYAYKIENTTKTLIEFNYNAGIVDNLGQPTSYASALTHSDQFHYQNTERDVLVRHYIGPGAGFVGTPYVVLMNVGKDIMKDMTSHTTIAPCLRFAALDNGNEARSKLDQRINMHLVSRRDNTDAVAQSNLEAVKAAAAVTEAGVAITEAAEEAAGLTGAIKSGTAKLDQFANKVDAGVDHLMDVGIGGWIVDKKGWKGKLSKEVNLLRESVDESANNLDSWFKKQIDKL
jgi:hypothetical protein